MSIILISIIDIGTPHLPFSRGMGYSTVKHLYFKGAKVYLGARDETQAKKAIDNLKQTRQSVLGQRNEVFRTFMILPP